MKSVVKFSLLIQTPDEVVFEKQMLASLSNVIQSEQRPEAKLIDIYGLKNFYLGYCTGRGWTINMAVVDVFNGKGPQCN